MRVPWREVVEMGPRADEQPRVDEVPSQVTHGKQAAVERSHRPIDRHTDSMTFRAIIPGAIPKFDMAERPSLLRLEYEHPNERRKDS